MKITGLFVYPVKACQGIAVDESYVTRRGLTGDRRWMVTDHAGRFLSQRDNPALARVRASISVTDDGPAQLVLSADGATRLERPWSAGHREDRRSVEVWGSSCPAIEDREASSWFSDVLKRDVRAVFQPQDSWRAIDVRHASSGDQVSFADAYPVLLTTEASLADLNSRMDRPVCQRRFRPNIVLDGGRPFEEDDYRALSLGACRFRMVKSCDRCVVTTLDPNSGEPGKEPLATLARYRRWDNKVWFGVNLVPEQEQTIQVGDSAVIEERAGE